MFSHGNVSLSDSGLGLADGRMTRRVLGEEERADRAAALAIDCRIGLVGAADRRAKSGREAPTSATLLKEAHLTITSRAPPVCQVCASRG